MKKINPIGERLLVRQKVEEETVSSSGFILSGEGKKIHPVGEVVAIGTGEKVKQFKVGDELLFDEWGGLNVNEDLSGEKNLLILGFDKIIASLCPINQ